MNVMQIAVRSVKSSLIPDDNRLLKHVQGMRQGFWMSLKFYW